MFIWLFSDLKTHGWSCILYRPSPRVVVRTSSGGPPVMPSPRTMAYLNIGPPSFFPYAPLPANLTPHELRNPAFMYVYTYRLRHTIHGMYLSNLLFIHPSVHPSIHPSIQRLIYLLLRLTSHITKHRHTFLSSSKSHLASTLHT